MENLNIKRPTLFTNMSKHIYLCDASSYTQRMSHDLHEITSTRTSSIS